MEYTYLKLIEIWYSNKTNKSLIRFDDEDIYICKVCDEFVNYLLSIEDKSKEIKKILCNCPPHCYYDWEIEENKCMECEKPIHYTNEKR